MPAVLVEALVFGGEDGVDDVLRHGVERELALNRSCTRPRAWAFRCDRGARCFAQAAGAMRRESAGGQSRQPK
jgi:hypothetical protein